MEFNFIDFLSQNWLFVVFLLGFIIQLFYIIFFYFRLIFRKIDNNLPKKFPPVSVIIAAKNEAENLKKFLPKILSQDYPDFQVIVVNDASEDDTDLVLAELKQKFSNLYFTTIPKDETFSHGKKLALSVGIKAAKNDILVFTDADCYPIDNQWIKYIIRNFDNSTDFVISYGGYERKKGLLNKLIRTDTVFTALNYLSYALAKVPYMGVGRNMAYRKQVFYKAKGFAKHLHLLSGSDDLFVNQNANGKNLKVELNSKAFTLSVPKKTLGQWIAQKQRHLTTGKFYKFKHKFLLATEYFSRLIFYLFFIILLVQNSWLYATLGVFIFRFLLINLVFLMTNKILKERGLWIFEMIYDFLQIFLNFFLYLSSIFNRKTKKYWL